MNQISIAELENRKRSIMSTMVATSSTTVEQDLLDKAGTPWTA